MQTKYADKCVVYVELHLAQSSLTSSASRLETMRITLYQESVSEFRGGWICSGIAKRFIVVIIIYSVLYVTGIRNLHITYSVIKFNSAYLMELSKSEINLLEFNIV